MEFKDIEKIISLIKESDISEAEIEHGDVKLKLKRGVFSATSVPQSFHVVEQLAPSAPAAKAGAPAQAEAYEGCKIVESPIVGTFYRKPSPDADNFVEVGDRVKEGQTLCIVEAMKLMNEISAPCSGVIEKVLISEGSVVEFAEKLFVIRPS